MSSESDASYAGGGSIALFSATVLFHRRYMLYRERRHKATTATPAYDDGNEGRHSTNINGTGSFDAMGGYYGQRGIGRARRISFDGHASFTATDTNTTLSSSTNGDGDNGRRETVSNASSANGDGDDTTLLSSFRIFGGDEMDDDEVDQSVANYYHSTSNGANAWGGGVMTSAGATAAKRAQQQLRLRGSPIQEGDAGEEEEGFPDDDGGGDGDDAGDDDGDFDVGASTTSWARVLNTLGRGASFFVEGADDDGMSYNATDDSTDIDSSGRSTTATQSLLSASTTTNAPSSPMGDRRSSSQPSMTDLASLAQQQSIEQKRALNRRESAKAEYNSQIMPNKVVLIRHGQSEGNVEESLYATTPDNAMKLTALGWDQAKLAGSELKSSVIGKDESIHFIVSPYVRTVETFHGILSAWCDPKEFDHIKDPLKRMQAWYGRLSDMGISWHEDPRIREQDFGNYQDPVAIKKCKRERHRFGTFYYRFPHGESASDVYDRVSTFLDSLWRSFDLKRSQNYVLVTHGISIRILLSRYFRYSIDQFNTLANPKNCDLVVLGHDGKGRLRLEGRHELILCDNGDDEQEGEETMYKSQHQSITLVKGYKYESRLRTLPKEWRAKRKIRLSYDD
eukprot:CAMPEP_0181075354 /NCGR_PEP_ID=MMETSP1070-20121207/30064_1 /TAXON_ID=265543 /ORGANISM="Minutocellus polymorphus, Strain NH13" /LENGTH=622 /DNA_ID=CAMNT_0023156479 /DNA_START=16 /DNA_END=1881 /DNA_ORIENTATION=-